MLQKAQQKKTKSKGKSLIKGKSAWQLLEEQPKPDVDNPEQLAARAAASAVGAKRARKVGTDPGAPACSTAM